MLEVIPSGKILGATINGLDLAQPLSAADFAAVRDALGAHGVLVPKDRAAHVTPAVVKASAGATEHDSAIFRLQVCAKIVIKVLRPLFFLKALDPSACTVQSGEPM